MLFKNQMRLLCLHTDRLEQVEGLALFRICLGDYREGWRIVIRTRAPASCTNYSAKMAKKAPKRVNP